ncbi:MAG: hypothetical protein ABTR92_18910 [Candidatus Accumulibacter phosphatis]|uniref:hypothetical protein n=1 Tax=Candidatus Accumulibacter sp. ACC012 TaxID=2823332 RepID=UPI0025BCC94E|nr:hypothetical protein [Candidatus Accumulibacter sp. ACC012]
MTKAPGLDHSILFVGATELAMLDLLRQEYVENKEVKYFFVVDFPRMAKAHCVPPLHLSMPEIAGLLRSPTKEVKESGRSRSTTPQHDLRLIKGLADKYPETLGLAEVLSRFVFDTDWSENLPKIMLSTQTAEAASIEDALRRQSVDEWSRSVSDKRVNQALDSFLVLYRESGRSIDDFIKAVAEKAEALLPGIYGEYSQVRQFLRFEDIKPKGGEDDSESRVMYAHGFSEFRPYLHEIADGSVGEERFKLLRNSWRSSIPDTYSRITPSETAERIRINRNSDADTLATIEYLNNRLIEDEKPYRLVFLSDDSKLFAGAIKRFRLMEDNRSLLFNPERSLGTASAFHRSRYSAHLLLSTRYSELQKVPLLDPRALMTGRRFVDFSVAGRHREENIEPVRAITEWLPIFFDGQERDRKAIARTYLHIQQNGGKGDGIEMSADMFEERQYEALKSHWSSYVRTVGTAHGLTRYATRSHLRDVFLALVRDDQSAVEKAIHRQLDNVMSEWLPALGGATLLGRRSSEARLARGAARIRSVPPLLLPAWPVVQRSLLELLRSAVAYRGGGASPKLEWITNPTASNLGLKKPWDAIPPWNLHYIQSVGLAYGFASEGNWTASYRLASSAFSLAELRRDPTGSPDENYVSGREAAFLASLAARRSLAARPVYLQLSETDIERNLTGRLRQAIELESKLFDENGWGRRREAHELRLTGEVLSWCVYRQLCEIMRSCIGDVKRVGVADYYNLSDIKVDTWDVYSSVLGLRSEFNQDTECDARDDYSLSLTYLGRQVLFNLLQVEVFQLLAREASPGEAVAEHIEKVLTALLDFSPSRDDTGGASMPWSCFENHVLRIAVKLGGIGRSLELGAALCVDERLAEDGVSEEHTKPMEHSLSEWRIALIMKNGVTVL